MLKKSSFSSKVLPDNRKFSKPTIPAIKIYPKLRSIAKIASDPGDSTISNSKSTSFLIQTRKVRRKNSLNLNSKENSEISDCLCFEEYKKNEILRSRKIHDSKFPYWFIDNFNDLEMSRSLRNFNGLGPDLFNKSNNAGLKNWIQVSFI